MNTFSNNTLLDNSESYRMVDCLKTMLLNEQCAELKIASGYWDLPGMKVIYPELKSFLERGGKLDLLIGEEPPVRQYQLDSKQKHDEQFPDFYIRRDIQRLNEDYIDVAKLLVDFSNPEDEDNSQIRVRVYGKKGEDKFLHAKCYIFLGQGFAKGIIGSSNFTEKGLQENAELNYLETNTLVVSAADNAYTNTKSHLTWFMEKWEEGEPWTGVFIQIINTLPGTSTPQPLTPYEVYIRLLQDRFGTIVDETMDEVLKTYLDGTIYKPLDYQLDAVKELYWKMQDMGGFLLADVVGLGKTICGILLAKYHLEHTSRSKKVLIITPPAIQSSWKDTIAEFNNGSHSFKLEIGKDIDFVTTGSIEKIADAELADSLDDYNNSDDDSAMSPIDTSADYSLILIDESHKFRNNNTRMYEDLQNVIEGICERTNHYPYVGLLSATPQNNRPYDLLNQILLFEHEPEKSHFDRIPNRDLRAFFKRINDEYKIARQLLPQQANPLLINLAQEVRDKVLECIMVRRTRTDIQNNYNSGLVFPDIIGPVKLEYKMDQSLATAFSNTMDAIGMGGTLVYARYRAIEELTPQLQKRYTYGSMTAKKSADSLARIVQMLLVKRLESSFDAFRKSLANQKRAIENMLQMIADDSIFICPDFDVNAELDITAKRAKNPSKAITYQTCYDDIRVRIQRWTQEGKNVRGQNAEYHAADFSNIAQYKQNLQSDLTIIDGLIADWQKVNTDPKLDEFCARLQNDIMKPDSIRIGRHLQELTFELTKAKNAGDRSLEDSINEEIKRIHNISVKVATNNDLERKLVIFSEAIDTVKRLEKVCNRLGFRVLTITAENREREKDNIRLNFDANVPTHEQRDDYDIIITTEVLAEGINLHRANAIVNYDSPWNATKLIQRIGRVNRIGSKAAAVFVYNFHPSAQGNDIIALVENAYAKLQSFHIMFGEDNAIFSDTEQVVSYATSINGTASPLQAFLLELRNYKKANPSRYNQIASAPLTQLEIAADAQGLVMQHNQETLCAIRQNETSYVLVDATMQAKVVSTLEAFHACQCNPATPAEALPTNIAQIQQAAEQELINYQNKLSAQQRSAKVYIDALAAIRQLQTMNLAPQSQQDLSKINRIVRGGNSWVARKIGKLGADIVAKQHSTVPYTQADIELALYDIISKVQLPNTTAINPTHFITFCKI